MTSIKQSSIDSYRGSEVLWEKGDNFFQVFADHIQEDA